MGKFRCLCGEVISTSGESPHEWLMIPEQEFGTAWDAGHDLEQVFQRMRRMYICPASGHVWIFWNGFSGRGTCYSPEENLTALNASSVGTPIDDGTGEIGEATNA